MKKLESLDFLSRKQPFFFAGKRFFSHPSCPGKAEKLSSNWL
jgi:hypothetical protein